MRNKLKILYITIILFLVIISGILPRVFGEKTSDFIDGLSPWAFWIVFILAIIFFVHNVIVRIIAIRKKTVERGNNDNP